MSYWSNDLRDDEMKNECCSGECHECHENDENSVDDSDNDNSVTGALSTEQKRELEICQEESKKRKDLLLRVTADFDNYKKRVERDRAAWNDIAQASVLKAVLPIVDDFDRAIKEHQKKERTPEMDAWLEGFELIAKSLNKFLEEHNVTEISDIHVFDPHIHDAFAQIESPDHESGHIVDVVKRGFFHKDTVLRPAKVVVAK